ncbi:DUF3347 domain-containing protein [Puia sp. P3]|uniref:DUF3347 domain-containing protein n=1 Tax=Puia sp. P3 TaxID=3423952 RepID=UPI003D66D608
MQPNYRRFYTSRIFLLLALFISICSQNSFAQDGSQPSSLSQLLPSYYSIKDALVNSDANAAASKAAEFAKIIKAVDMKTLPNSEMTVFMSLQDKLADDATHIASNKDIKHQREHFATFSSNLFALAKGLKLNSKPVYYDYCPMKKAYWLSNEASIKNPYFGSAMLTCGKTTETLK